MNVAITDYFLWFFFALLYSLNIYINSKLAFGV